MKNAIRSLAVLSMATLMTGCGTADLTADEAKTVILENFSYPEAVNKQIFCGDINQAKRLLDLGFEQEGWVLITKSKKASEMSKPWITFTAKSRPYLLPTPDEEAKYKRQNIKIGEIHFDNVAGVFMDKDGKAAMVTYNTRYQNLTPFARFFKFDFDKVIENRAYFLKYNDSWKLEKNPGALLLRF
jgi:hypothetical protein